jgi:hypothetical protein
VAASLLCHVLLLPLLLLLPSISLTKRAASLLSRIKLIASLPGKLNSTQGVWPPCKHTGTPSSKVGSGVVWVWFEQVELERSPQVVQTR